MVATAVTLRMRVFNLVYGLILGAHPDNTVFSFNYHNVRQIKRFLAAFRDSLDARRVIVDVGAGSSPYYPVFSGISKRYIAVDAEESFPAERAPSIEYMPGFAEAVPLSDMAADVVLCNQVLEHVNDPAKAVGEIYRILKPGGFLLGSVPHVSPVHLEPKDYRRFTDLGIMKLLKEAGYAEIIVEGNVGAHSAAAFMIAMDWMLSERRDGEGQVFSAKRALLLAPLVGLLNASGMLLDAITGNKRRTPSNLCFKAIRPS